jgi:hypothetical protein
MTMTMTMPEKVDFRQECQRRRAAGLILVGDTYAVKDTIKALGGIWDKFDKSWLMPDADTLARAQVLVNAQPKKTTTRTGGYRRSSYRRSGPYECEECGDRVYPGSTCWETGVMH